MKTAILATTLLLCLAAVIPTRAQSTGEVPDAFHVDTRKAPTATGSTAATASVVQDPRIQLLIEKQIYVNTLALRNMPGFRVQVISTMNRAKATAAKAKLMELFPQYKTYLSYQSPYFRVRIGDFPTREDAEQLQQQLGDYFPNGVFTVRDVIHLSPEQLLQNLNNDPEN
jgi:septal ring-binding cell division protein DamX